MKKRGAVQRRNELRNRISTILCLGLFIILAVIFTIGCVEQSIILREWNEEHIQVYRGDYTVEKIDYPFSKYHHCDYRFYLDNGDTISVSDNYVEQAEHLMARQAAGEPVRPVFRYPRYCAISNRGRYTAVSITGSDGTDYVREETMLSSTKLNRGFLFIIALVIDVPMILAGFLYCYTRYRKYKRKQEKRRKKEARRAMQTNQSP